MMMWPLTLMSSGEAGFNDPMSPPLCSMHRASPHGDNRYLLHVPVLSQVRGPIAVLRPAQRRFEKRVLFERR